MSAAISVWIMLAGAVAACGIVVGIVYWERRQRRLRRVRPPVSGKLLRPAGHTLALKLEKLDEKLTLSLGMTMGAGAVLTFLLANLVGIAASEEVQAYVGANGLMSLALAPKLLPAMLSFGALLIATASVFLYGTLTCISSAKERSNVHLGLRGEQAVAETLLESAGHGYRSFHDYPGGPDWNIDHVVVGPGGVFAIETKARSKEAAPPGVQDHLVRYDGMTLRFPRGPEDGPIEQAKRNAKTLAGILSKATGMKLWVQPLLVVPGWYVEATNNPSNHAVHVTQEKLLPGHLKRLPHILTNQQIQQIAHQIEQKCRDVEF